MDKGGKNMIIEERIKERERIIRKLNNAKDNLEEQLNQINKKIIAQYVAVNNLKIKNTKIEYDRMKNPSK